MAKKKSFIFYHSYKEAFLALSGEESRELLLAMIDYDSEGKVHEFSTDGVKMAFTFIKGNMDRDAEKYEKLCAKQRENAMKRWHGDATAYNNMPSDAKDTDNDNEKDSDNANEIVNVIDKENEKENGIPSLEEIKQYCYERGNQIDAEKFYDYYSVTGWRRGNSKITDWKACIRLWERNAEQAKVEIIGESAAEEFMRL